MSERFYHLAQVNIARAKAPLTDPLLREFVEQIDAVNQAAEKAPGFMWRYKDEDDVPGLDDPCLLFNVSVWRDLESLVAYVRGSDHLAVMRRRAEWFERMATPSLRCGGFPRDTCRRPRRRSTVWIGWPSTALAKPHSPFAMTFRSRHPQRTPTVRGASITTVADFALPQIRTQGTCLRALSSSITKTVAACGQSTRAKGFISGCLSRPATAAAHSTCALPAFCRIRERRAGKCRSVPRK